MLEPLAESLLDPGQKLHGACVATRQSAFSGTMTAILVTDETLVIQDLSRKFEPKGEPLRLRAQDIATVSAGGGGGGWWTAEAAIMDSLSTQLKLRTTDGQKLKLLMMDGRGGPIGNLGGGEAQKQGVQALGEWFARNAPES